MKAECFKAISQAVGRAITKAEANEIETRLTKHMRNQARVDPEWLGKSNADRLTEAAKLASEEMIGEVQLKRQRASLTVLAHDRIDQHIKAQATKGIGSLEALDRTVAFHADHKSNFLSVESQSRAVERDALRQMLGTLTASNPKWFGLFENHEGIKSVVKEIFGESSGNADAARGAKEWQAVTAALRDRFNRAGGDVGQLEDWGLPHHHSQTQVAKVGREQWVAETLPFLNREKYFNADGTRMTDAQLGEFLGNAWATIATGGANKVEPGQFRGSGARANRGNESRQIHFKDSDSYLAYQDKYGERSLYEVLTGHITGISKDIALVETFGPNPDHAFHFIAAKYSKEAIEKSPIDTGKVTAQYNPKDGSGKTANLFNEVSGKTLPVGSEHLAKTFDTLRNWLVASRLGSAIITSFSDEATLHLTARLNKLPEMRLLANELAAFNPANRMEERMALRAGLAMNTFISSLNRFGQRGLGVAFSKKLASTTLRASGLNAATEARKRAFGVTMMHSLGSVTREHGKLSDLDANDHHILLSKGINETDFAVWKKAQLEDWGDGNNTMLTPESIYRIPDENIDQVITDRIGALKTSAKEQIIDLRTRDAQDHEWMNKRAERLTQWLEEQKGSLAKRIADAKDENTASLQKIQSEMEAAAQDIKAVDYYWKHGVRPSDEIREIGGKKTVGILVDKGRAEEQLRSLNARSTRLGRELESFKKGITGKVFESYFDQQAELQEFIERAQKRIERRSFVADRIERGIEPAIANERARTREQAATKLLGAVLEETDVAVIEPGAKERVITGGNTQRGTWKGELTRSFFLFKSFPLAMIQRHWERGMSLPNAGGRAAYLATLMAATTVAGMVSLQIGEVLQGRDPRNMNLAKKGGVRNWIAAMLKGGSLGIYGDFLFSEASQHGSSPLATLTGPVIGSAEDVLNLTQGNIMQAAQGKKANVGAETVKFVKSNLPGASLWYAKGALNHLIFDRLQDYFSPGYLASMRSRAEREFGQKYYWSPGQASPDRAPDIAAMAGD